MDLKFLLVFLVSLIGAIFDIKARRIPNWLTFGTFFLALTLSIFTLNLSNILNCILGFIAGILLLIIPYKYKGMGAGDVKLLGAIGSILGYKSVVVVFFYTAISGLIIGAGWILFNFKHITFLIKTGQPFPVTDKKEKVPYGVSIFIGAITYLLVKNRFFPLFN